jgi:hypothetical protein
MASKIGEPIGEPIYPQTSEFNVYRRELITTVHMSYQGTENPIAAAYKAIADAMADDMNSASCNYEFVCWDRTFRASVDAE